MRTLLLAAFAFAAVPSFAADSCTASKHYEDREMEGYVCFDSEGLPLGVSFKTEWTRGWRWLAAADFSSEGYTLLPEGLRAEKKFGAEQPILKFEYIEMSGRSEGIRTAADLYLLRQARDLESAVIADRSCAAVTNIDSSSFAHLMRIAIPTPVSVCLSSDGKPVGVSHKTDAGTWAWTDARELAAEGYILTEGGLYVKQYKSIRQFHGFVTGDTGNKLVKDLFIARASAKRAAGVPAAAAVEAEKLVGSSR